MYSRRPAAKSRRYYGSRSKSSVKYSGRKLTYTQKRQVKRIVGNTEETKAVDTAALTTIDSSGNTIYKLVHPAQGDTYQQREGDQITLKRLRYRLNFVGADNTNVIRFIIFRWKENDAATLPLYSDIIQNLSPMAMYNYVSQQQSKFHIVMDRTVTFSLNGTADIKLEGVLYGKRLGNKRLHFNAGANTGPGCFYWMAVSDSAAAPHPSVGGYLRMEFTDS